MKRTPQYHAVRRSAVRLLRLVGVGLFFWILSRIDVGQVISILLHIHAGWFVLSFFAFFFVVICLAIRLHVLINACGHHLPFPQSWRIYNLGVFLANITPGKIGELGRAVYLRKLGMTKSNAAILGIFGRVIDQMVTLVLATASVSILFGGRWFLPSLSLVSILSIVFCILGWCGNSFIKRPLLFSCRHTFSIVMLTVVGLTSYYCGLIFLSWSVGIHLDAITLFAIFNITAIVTSLPIAPAGLGTREVALITLFHLYSISSPHAVATSQLIFFMTLVLTSIGFFYWLQNSGTAPNGEARPEKIVT